VIRYIQASKHIPAFIAGVFSVVVTNAFCEDVTAKRVSSENNTESSNIVKEKKSVKFNNGFMVGNLAGMDLSAFDNETVTQPGNYQVDVKINERSNGTKKVKYVAV